MRGITLGVFSAQPIYDVDFQTNVLDVAQTMGYAIPPLEKRLLLNRLMVDMKNIGFFQLQDTLANFALGISGYEQFRMIDWKRTGDIYSAYGGFIYKPEGIEGNGADAFVDTNFNPAIVGVNYTLNNASRSAIIYKEATDLLTNNRVIDGVAGSLTANVMYNAAHNNHRINIVDTQGVSISLQGTGLKNISRLNDVVLGISRDSEEQSIRPSVELYNSNQVLLSRGASLSSGVFGTSGISMYCMGASIPYPMSQSFRTIYNQFLSDSGLSSIA